MENRELKLSIEEKESSLKAKFWNDKQKIDKNTSLMKDIEKICKDIDFNKKN